ncbi:MAG: hypothetical protein PHH00_00875 [Candidatus Nanoarchaeia archaeon]|nr:hypothetical protein [Candidatus Nanoarchaeia archaeon]
MKKSIIPVLFFALLILPAISAVQVEMKSNFSQDETLIAQVSGNFLEKIQEQNVLLYNGHVRVSFIPYVAEIEDKFYIYGQLFGKSEGNYSVVISGVDYFESGETKDDDVVKNFTITNETADFSLTPGFLETTGNFSITAQNLMDTALTVTSFIKNSTGTETGFFGSLFGGGSTGSGKTETQISAGKTKSITFSPGNSYNNQLIYAILETDNTHYEVPVFVLNNTIQEENKSAFEFRPNHRSISLATNSSTFIYLNLYNSGQTTFKDVSVSVSDIIKPYVFIQNQTLVLDANSSTQIRANISSGNLNGIFEGQITAASENLTYDFILTLNFSKSYVPPANGTNLFYTCVELGGQFCNEGQTCAGEGKLAEDGAGCCVGECNAVAANTNSGRIFGWMLAAIIVLLVIVFFVWRYFKAKKPFNLLDFARKR